MGWMSAVACRGRRCVLLSRDRTPSNLFSGLPQGIFRAYAPNYQTHRKRVNGIPCASMQIFAIGPGGSVSLPRNLVAGR